MTSDAKIGLLLGLVFIFIIAFIINGLPSFRHKAKSNELTTNMTTFDDGQLGIGVKERKTQEALDRMELDEDVSSRDIQTSAGGQDIRSITPLPESLSIAKEPDNSTEIEHKNPSPAGAQETIPSTALGTGAKIQPAWPKLYVVSEDDNLASIAKKLYGPEQGNKRINIDRIFEANRRLLKSPDEIYVGQKLIIPPPSNLTQDGSKIDGVFSSTMFEKVESIGKKLLSADGGGTKTVPSTSSGQERWYTVREDDNLWKIAAAQLGNGNRYTEIAKLNADIIDNENNIAVGMRLKIPAR
jgi:nucleoid-associated protein YgaU